MADPGSTEIVPKAAQPANFAKSKADILQTLQYYFGDPAYPQKLMDYTEHHAATGHFPDAYVGQSLKLRDTLTNLITSHQQDWMTTTVLPWRRIEGINVQWDEAHFDIRLLQRVPYEGVSRLQTSLRRQFRERAVRRGIGMILESDFYTTPTGKKQFSDNLLSIQLSVQETANFDGLFAFLTCPNHDYKYDLARGLVPRRSIISAMRKEVGLFAIMQKDGRGFDRVIEDAKQRMGRYHVIPNTMIIAPQMSLYVAMGPEERINYSIAGPGGITQFDAGPAGFESRPFRGLRLFTVNPFDVGDAKESVQMLARSVQTGEYYAMSAPVLYDPSKPIHPDACDIVIYDEDRDQLVRITMERALRHCMAPEVFKALQHSAPARDKEDVDSDSLDFLRFHAHYLDGKHTNYQRTMKTLLTALPEPASYGFNAADKPLAIAALLLQYPDLFMPPKAQKATAAAARDDSENQLQVMTSAQVIAALKTIDQTQFSLLPNPVDGVDKGIDFANGVGKGACDNANTQSFVMHRKTGLVYCCTNKGSGGAKQWSLYDPANFDDVDSKASTIGNDKLKDRSATAELQKKEVCLKLAYKFMFWMRTYMYGGNTGYKNLERLAAALRCGLWVPLEVVITRPFIEHQMLSTIITVAGQDTGSSLFGLADMQLSANTSTKVIEGHYTCHTKSIITKPQNVLIQENVFSNGYVAGCNTVFFGENTPSRVWEYAGLKGSPKVVVSAAVRQAISNRLAFSLDYSEARQDVYESMLAFIVPHGSTAEMPEQAFNLTRRFLPWEVSGNWPEKKQFPGGGLIWRAYNDLLQLDQQILAGEDLQSREQRGFMSGGTNNNSVMFAGPHRVFNYLTSGFNHLMPGQGHWGADALPGDARWRRGETVSMKDAREAMRYGDHTNEKSLIFTP